MADATNTTGNNRNVLIRNRVADYLSVSGTYELMGVGFKSLNESPKAQTDSVTYINESTSSTDITGYETEFAYEANHIPSQKAITALWKDGRNHATGPDALHTYVRVDLYNPVGTPSSASAEYMARQFTVANEVSDYEGDGGEKVSVSGTLHAVGDPVQGKFNTVAKTFTAGTFTGTYDA
jgi:hypothetical protein